MMKFQRQFLIIDQIPGQIMIDFSYLRPPRNISHLKYSIRAVEIDRETNKKTRILFQNVSYEPEEKEAIHKFRQYMKQREPTRNYPEHILLKFCHMGSFHIQQSASLLKIYDQWHQNEQITTQTAKTRRILESGVFYQYGRDPTYHPVIYFRPSKINLTKFSENDYFSAINYLLTVVEQHMLIGGAIELWILIIDFQHTKPNIPVQNIENAVRRISSSFPYRLKHLFIINANKNMGQLINQLKQKINPSIFNFDHSRIQNLKFLNELNHYIDPDQREKKYEGRMDNLYEFWPIKSTNKLHEQSTLYPLVQSQTQFESVINDENYFLEGAQSNTFCPSSCEIM